MSFFRCNGGEAPCLDFGSWGTIGGFGMYGDCWDSGARADTPLVRWIRVDSTAAALDSEHLRNVSRIFKEIK